MPDAPCVTGELAATLRRARRSWEASLDASEASCPRVCAFCARLGPAAAGPVIPVRSPLQEVG